MTEQNKQKVLQIIQDKQFYCLKTYSLKNWAIRHLKKVFKVIKTPEDVQELHIFCEEKGIRIELENDYPLIVIRISLDAQMSMQDSGVIEVNSRGGNMNRGSDICLPKEKVTITSVVSNSLHFPTIKGCGLSGRFVFEIEDNGNAYFNLLCGEETDDGCLDDRGLGKGDKVIKELFKDYKIELQASENNHKVWLKEGETFDQFKDEATKRLLKAGAIPLT